MLKCSRLRWVCAPQYRWAGTSTWPRLSDSCRVPAASSPMGRSWISGVASVMACGLLSAGPGPRVGHNTEEDGRYFRQRADFMRVRAGVAIDLGTVNTLVYVAGRGIVVDEPSAIALDRATGSVASVGQV